MLNNDFVTESKDKHSRIRKVTSASKYLKNR